MDLRKPKIVKRIHLPREHPGLTDFLSGQAFISDVIQKTESMPNLHIIGSGSQVPNPSQLLEKRSLENLLTTLKENYDDIIIDSPPVHLIPDALILSQFTDLTLYMIRQGVTGRDEIKFIQNLHHKNQLNNLNLVFNCIQKSKYGYGYDFEYSYNYIAKRNSLLAPFRNFFDRF